MRSSAKRKKGQINDAIFPTKHHFQRSEVVQISAILQYFCWFFVEIGSRDPSSNILSIRLCSQERQAHWHRFPMETKSLNTKKNLACTFIVDPAEHCAEAKWMRVQTYMDIWTHCMIWNHSSIQWKKTDIRLFFKVFFKIRAEHQMICVF